MPLDTIATATVAMPLGVACAAGAIVHPADARLSRVDAPTAPEP